MACIGILTISSGSSKTEVRIKESRTSIEFCGIAFTINDLGDGLIALSVGECLSIDDFIGTLVHMHTITWREYTFAFDPDWDEVDDESAVDEDWFTGEEFDPDGVTVDHFGVDNDGGVDPIIEP